MVHWQPAALTVVVVGAVSAAGIAAIMTQYNSAKKGDILEAEKLFTENAFQISYVLALIFTTAFQRFGQVAGVFASERGIPHSTFMGLSLAVRPTFGIDRNIVPSLYDLMWAPVIKHENRSQLEAAISTARNATFQVRTLSETGTAFRAPNASEYMPLLDLSDSNPTGQPLWGVDVLSLPILRPIIDTVIRTKRPSLTEGLCFSLPFARDAKTGFFCSPQRLFVVVPIVSNPALDAYAHAPLKSGPLVNATQYFYRGNSTGGEVIGVAIGYVYWVDAGTVVLSSVPSSDMSEPMTHISLFIEDVTGVPGYPVSDCTKRQGLLLHNKPFGSGSPVFVLPVDEVTPETATYHNTIYPSRNQIMCIGERQWNIVLILPPQHMAKMVTNHRGTVLELGMLSMIPIIALVAVVVHSTSRLLWITAESDKLKHSKRKAEVDSYESAMMFACDELEAPLMEIVASTGQLQCDSPTAAEKHGLSDHKVSTNVEIMTISSKKMKSRLRTMRMLANSQAGHVMFDKEEFAIRPFVMEMAKVHRSFGVVPIHWFVERAVPVKITQALEGIEQIIANGLTNSCKFCADETNGFIRIEVRMPEPNLLRFAVVDNGCGLGGKTSDELMTTFNTGCGAKTTTTNANGVVDTSKKAASSGLGLSFSKKVAISLGGSLVLAEVEGTTQLMLHVPFEHRNCGNGTSRGSYVDAHSSVSHTASREGELDGDSLQEDCVGFVLPMVTGYDDDDDDTEDGSTCNGSNHDMHSNLLADGNSTVTGRSSTDISYAGSPENQRSPQLPTSDVMNAYLPCSVPERAELPVIWEVPMEALKIPDAPSSKVVPLASPEGNRTPLANSEESGDSTAPVPDVGSPNAVAPQPENVPPISVARYLPPVNPSRRFSLTGTLSSTGSASTRGIHGMGHSWKNRRSISRGTSGGSSPDRGSARGNGCFLPPLVPPSNSLPLSSSRTSDSGGPGSGRRSLRVLLYEPDRIVLRQMDTWERRSGFRWLTVTKPQDITMFLQRSGDLRSESVVEFQENVTRFDACVMDVDDQEEAVTDMVKSMRLKGCAVHFIAVTSDWGNAKRKRVFDAGFKEVVLKPYTEAMMKEGILSVTKIRPEWIAPLRTSSVSSND